MLRCRAMFQPMRWGLAAAMCASLSACTTTALKDDGDAGAVNGGTSVALGFTCKKQATTSFAPVTTKRIAVPDLPAPSGTAPTITTQVTSTETWGSSIRITGTGFGDGVNGEYVSFGSGARELRVPATQCNSSIACTQLAWSATSINVPAPLGADGDIVVHTRGGSVKVGTFTPPWLSSGVFSFSKEESYGETLASIATPEGTTYFVRRFQRESGSTSTPSTPSTTHVVLFRVSDDGAVASAMLDPLTSAGPVARAELARAPDGSVDLAIVSASAARLHLVHIRGNGSNDIDIDDGCVPVDSTGPLAFQHGPSGLVAWVSTASSNGSTRGTPRALMRLVYTATTSTWRVDRQVTSAEPVRGHGVELPDGSVGFAWGEGAGGAFDSKASPSIAVLPAGATEVESIKLEGPLDDYVYARAFATPSGFVMTYCNYDATGFLNDTGTAGVKCRVLKRIGPRQWSEADGYPNGFANLDHDFGLVGDRIASVHRIGARGTFAYFATADATPGAIVHASASTTVRLVRSDGAPRLLVTSNDQVAIVRPR